MIPRKLTIWLQRVARWLAGEEVIFPADVAKAYILYRKQREKVRNMKSTILDYKELVDSYVKVSDFG